MVIFGVSSFPGTPTVLILCHIHLQWGSNHRFVCNLAVCTCHSLAECWNFKTLLQLFHTAFCQFRKSMMSSFLKMAHFTLQIQSVHEWRLCTSVWCTIITCHNQGRFHSFHSLGIPVYIANTVGTIYYIFTCKFGLLKVDGWGQNPIAPMQEVSYTLMTSEPLP